MKALLHLAALYLIFLATSNNCFSQTWNSQSSPSGFILRGVSFIDANNGIAVGTSGLPGIIRTTNGGANWIAATTAPNWGFYSVSFVTGTPIAVAVGVSGSIDKTTDGGVTWVDQTSPNAQTLWAVSFTSTNIGTAVGNLGTIIRTTDGGANWTAQTSNTTNGLYSVSFTDANNGTVVGESGIILRTTNGGTNWTAQTSNTVNNLYGVSFIDANNGTAVGIGATIAKTTNGGTAWTVKTSGSNDLFGVSFTDANNGTAVGTNGTILRTTNGGTNWSGQTNNAGVYSLFGVSFTDANIGTAVGQTGIIERTTNGALPVELISFTGLLNGSEVVLSWKTATETNNYGFEVEKKQVSIQSSVIHWQKVGFVEGSGTTNSPKKYSFTETNLTSGKYSYRLKQIDRDGKIEYSKEVEVTVANAPKEFTLSQNYPNPFNPSTVISYQIPVNDHVSLTIYDALGREVGILVNETKEAGYYSAAFDASKLSSGIYFARLQSGERTQLKKMQLLK